MFGMPLSRQPHPNQPCEARRQRRNMTCLHVLPTLLIVVLLALSWHWAKVAVKFGFRAD